MKPKDIKLTDKFIWNPDCKMVSVNIPKKGEYNYSNVKGEIKVFCSKGEKYYELTYLGNSWMCSCPGFAYRRHCSHMDNIPKEILERVKGQKSEPKIKEDIVVRAAKNAFKNEYNLETGKMEPVYNKDGSRMSAYDEFWMNG